MFFELNTLKGASEASAVDLRRPFLYGGPPGATMPS